MMGSGSASRRRIRIADIISLSARWWAIWRGVHSPVADRSSSSSVTPSSASTTTRCPSRYWRISRAFSFASTSFLQLSRQDGTWKGSVSHVALGGLTAGDCSFRYRDPELCNRDRRARDRVVLLGAVPVLEVHADVHRADRSSRAVPVVGAAGAVALNTLPRARRGGPDPELVHRGCRAAARHGSHGDMSPVRAPVRDSGRAGGNRARREMG